jgi:GT2 family glycosyltransferase
MRIALVVIAYNQPEGIASLVASAASRRHDVAVELFLHSDHEPTVAVCEALAGSDHVRHHDHRVNRGVSRSWNDGILASYDDGADVVVVANDDIRFGDGDLDRLADKAAAHRERYVVSCAGPHLRHRGRLPSHGFACFAINPIALATIGCFDENFFPAYCEDQDYSRRARLAGLAEENCAATEVVHAGSSAIFSSPELARANALTQRHNMAYYRAKWGGDGDHERYDAPWDDPAIPLRIAPERRHAPYGPAHDRADALSAR